MMPHACIIDGIQVAHWLKLLLNQCRRIANMLTIALPKCVCWGEGLLRQLFNLLEAGLLRCLAHASTRDLLIEVVADFFFLMSSLGSQKEI